MKRQLETATEAPPKLESQNGAESALELLNSPELLNAPELLSANDAGLQAPTHDDVSLPEWDARRTQAQGLAKVRLRWAKRRLKSVHSGCCLCRSAGPLPVVASRR